MTPIVETSCGRIEGAEEHGVEVFRGIPYAQPPLGARRLRPPQPPEPWPGTRPALRFGPAAPQNTSMVAALLGLPNGETREDCLTLNVWTPRARPQRRPVLVWIHGGGFVFGSGSQPIYDGAALARRGDVVVVTIHYRLGALGWLGLPALAEEEGGVAGNFGLLDQIAALAWARENAEAFGGDPGNVTVFGESAGAMSVGTLLGTPAARGLFRRAILQSGAAHNVSTPEQAEQVAEALLKELDLGPRDVAKLREVPVQALLEAQQRCIARVIGGLRGLPFQPVLDGAVLPRAPLDAIGAGLAQGVAVLAGTNLDEMRLFGLADTRARTLDEAALLRRCERNVPGHGEDGISHGRRAVETYRRARQGRAPHAPPDLWFAIESDRVFRIPALRVLERQAAHAPAVHSYLFTWPSPALGGLLGSCHALEIPFVFGTAAHAALRPFTGEGPAVEALSLRMQDAWLSFARHGDPSGEGVRDWPAYEATRRATRVFGRECGVEDAPFEAEREFWEGLL